jgi:hypothetical protein
VTAKVMSMKFESPEVERVYMRCKRLSMMFTVRRGLALLAVYWALFFFLRSTPLAVYEVYGGLIVMTTIGITQGVAGRYMNHLQDAGKVELIYA